MILASAMYVQLLYICISTANKACSQPYTNQTVKLESLILSYYYYFHAQGSQKGLQYKTELPKKQVESFSVCGLQKFHGESLQPHTQNLYLFMANLFSHLRFMDLLRKSTYAPKI